MNATSPCSVSAPKVERRDNVAMADTTDLIRRPCNHPTITVRFDSTRFLTFYHANSQLQLDPS